MVYISKFENLKHPDLEFKMLHHTFQTLDQKIDLFRPSIREYFSLIWFKQGYGEYYIDFTKHKFKSDLLVIVSKNQVHYFDKIDVPFEFIELSFTENFISRSTIEIIQMLSFCMREHFEGKQILALDPQDSQYLGELASQIKEINSNWIGKEKTESLYHLLQLFLVYCYKLQQDQIKLNKLPGPQNYTEIVGKFTSLLEQNFKQTQKVQEYCDQLFLTYNTLSRHTKSYCGKTPKEIISERIVLETKRMLSASAMPIKEISYELGFDEPTNLVKYFKKHAGYTPSFFRENLNPAR